MSGQQGRNLPLLVTPLPPPRDPGHRSEVPPSLSAFLPLDLFPPHLWVTCCSLSRGPWRGVLIGYHVHADNSALLPRSLEQGRHLWVQLELLGEVSW